MIDTFITFLQDALLDVFRYPFIVVILLSILPIVEARLAIPMAISYGYNNFQSFLLGFFGSSLIVPLLLLVLIPFVNFLRRTKFFKKIGDFLYSKFEDKSKSLDGKNTDLKKMLGIFLFVAIPLPLTGVWTGSAIASIIGLKYPKALVSIVGGNLVASSIITLLCAFFSKTVVNYIILAIGIIALLSIVVLLIKFALSTRKKQTNCPAQTQDSDENNG